MQQRVWMVLAACRCSLALPLNKLVNTASSSSQARHPDLKYRRKAAGGGDQVSSQRQKTADRRETARFWRAVARIRKPSLEHTWILVNILCSYKRPALQSRRTNIVLTLEGIIVRVIYHNIIKEAAMGGQPK
jgi:hypothetical protein